MYQLVFFRATNLPPLVFFYRGLGDDDEEEGEEAEEEKEEEEEEEEARSSYTTHAKQVLIGLVPTS